LKILLTNDDGIHAKGLAELKNCLQKFGEVLVVAPDRDRSGAGPSTTFYKTVSCKEVWSKEEFFGYSVSGTPVDCVIIGIDKLCVDFKPDLIVSGINAGANLGQDIFYSGTVGAAIEGFFQDIFSIAISINKKEKPNYDTAIKVIDKIMSTLPTGVFKKQHLLNINIPNVEYHSIKRVILTKLAQVFHQKNIKEIYQAGRTKYFWIAGSQPEGFAEEGSDYWAVCNNFVSITDIAPRLRKKNTQYDLKEWIECINF